MKRVPLSIEVRRVLKLLIGTLFGMLLATSAYFFVKMSTTAEQGYVFRENQLRQRSLESENRILKQQLLEVQSIENLQKSAQFKEFVAPETAPVYVKPAGPISKKK